MSIPQRSAMYLAGRGRAVIPKIDMYKSELEFLRLKMAVDHGYLSWSEYKATQAEETSQFYKDLMGER
jgi:hypothetical protein